MTSRRGQELHLAHGPAVETVEVLGVQSVTIHSTRADAHGWSARSVHRGERANALRADGYSSSWAMTSGSGRRGARIHTSCAVVSAPTLDRAFARWCFTSSATSPGGGRLPSPTRPPGRPQPPRPHGPSRVRRGGGMADASSAADQLHGRRRLGETHGDRKVVGGGAPARLTPVGAPVQMFYLAPVSRRRP